MMIPPISGAGASGASPGGQDHAAAAIRPRMARPDTPWCQVKPGSLALMLLTPFPACGRRVNGLVGLNLAP